jgi:hypothetical protein
MMKRYLLLSLTVMLISSVVAVGQMKDDQFAYRMNGSPDPIKSIQIYPNPAPEVLTIKFEAPIANRVRVTLHNVIGNEMEFESELLDEHKIQIRVKDLANGYYLVSIKDDRANFSSTLKFLKR